MPSIDIDRAGDVGLGFSSSSPTTHPGIQYTGHLAGDPLGTMSQGEAVIIDGAGSQQGTDGFANRWGD